jgi:hypothetical protein
MTQEQLEQQVARRTGETVDTVRRIGFGPDRPAWGRTNLGRMLRLQSRRRRMQPAVQR